MHISSPLPPQSHSAVNFKLIDVVLLFIKGFMGTPHCSSVPVINVSQLEPSTHAEDQRHFEGIIDQLGVYVAEKRSIEQLVLRQNQMSKSTRDVTVLDSLCTMQRPFHYGAGDMATLSVATTEHNIQHRDLRMRRYRARCLVGLSGWVDGPRDPYVPACPRIPSDRLRRCASAPTPRALEGLGDQNVNRYSHVQLSLYSSPRWVPWPARI